MSFNPDKVLKDISKTPAELIIPKANKVMVGPCAPDEILQMPVTPVSAEALISLQTQIIKQDAHALDKTSRQSLERYIRKLTKATQISLAKVALQQDQIRFLMTINDEAKVQQSTKPVVLGKAKVMSYEDLIAKRAEREAKEPHKAKGTKNRDRKRKSPPKAGTLESSAEKTPVSEAPIPYRAPVARMW